MDRETWSAVIHGVAKSRTRLSDWTELKLKKGSRSQGKHSDPIGSQRTSWRVLRVATISLWEILLLASRNLELANAPTNPCYHRVGAAYDCCMYYLLSNLFCLCPGEQATACSASLTRIYKTTADHRKYHSCLDGHQYKDSQA